MLVLLHGASSYASDSKIPGIRLAIQFWSPTFLTLFLPDFSHLGLVACPNFCVLFCLENFLSFLLLTQFTHPPLGLSGKYPGEVKAPFCGCGTAPSHWRAEVGTAEVGNFLPRKGQRRYLPQLLEFIWRLGSIFILSEKVKDSSHDFFCFMVTFLPSR